MKNLKRPKNFKPYSIDEKTYPVFYNGRRVIILDSTADKEFGLDHKIVIWDKVMMLPMGWADQQTDGTFKGFVIYGMHEISVSGSDYSELAADCLAQHLWTMRN